MTENSGDGTRARGRRRVVVVVVGIVVVGLVVAGVAFVALSGGALFGGGAVAASPSASASPDASEPVATPSPSPSATEPAVPDAPVSRVPASCDELLPQETAEALAGAALPVQPVRQSASPVFYTDLRVGMLECAWADSEQSGDAVAAAQATLQILPGITAEGFEQEAQREGVYIATPEPSIGPDVYSACAESGLQPTRCGYIALVGGYAVALSAVGPQLDRDAVREQFITVRDAVAGFGEPGPLWQPAEGALAGATSCDTLIDPATLAVALGVEGVRPFKSDEGEYASSRFGSRAQVNSYYCSWSPDPPTGGTDVTASVAVLPGGAGYFEGWADVAEQVYEPAPDYPGEAYLAATETPGITELVVLIDGAWVRVVAPDAALLPVVETVLANIGAG
ncbi:hypothetical protein N1028_05145 [Herbiconiux sp. CPCC 203407]|uniref:DUF3558 domain-containing protein n=1 Tax=Herbiconiux oxytropis TaxID=2970915 RepID=A0AA41XHU9_9MICO|nr:hypothetical protein [Herbiconiux oxytropis]MCS5724127.1 hypothetical protein [Herbiconiux oxytropis]MCS5725276.1 hypothetical protein [Herbiconiux oxytropis]